MNVRTSRLLIAAIHFAAAFLFSVPGAFALCAFLRDVTTPMGWPMPVEVGVILAIAAVAALGMISRAKLSRSFGWALCLAGHAMLALFLRIPMTPVVDADGARIGATIAEDFVDGPTEDDFMIFLVGAGVSVIAAAVAVVLLSGRLPWFPFSRKPVPE